MKIGSNQYRNKRRGMILFAVSITVALIALGALSLLTMLTSEYDATVFHGDEIQADQLLQSGIEEIRVALTKTGLNVYDNPPLFQNVETVPAGFPRPNRGTGRFSVFTPRITEAKITGFRSGLTNESSKLHLASVLQWENELSGQGAKSLMNLPGMTPTIADSILDWIDSDKTPRASGAELDYYESLGLPFRPRNDIPAALEELLLVRDMKRELFFGTIKQTQESQLPWNCLLTVFSAEKLVNPQGVPKIFLNGGNIEFLEQQLREYLDSDSVRFVLRWRKIKGKIENEWDLLETLENETSPFLPNNERFLTLLDYATTSPEIVVRGRINVNEAPIAVLSAVPELTEAMVEQIITKRPKDGELAKNKTSGQFRHITWLLSEKIVDCETMKKISKRLTTGGDVYRANITGFFEGQRMTRRAEVVVDATVKPPWQIFFR